ncbi:MAG TPA: alpha/beta hydrolase [Aromatoleum sp.]|uniref:alpha/beta fold hydrolase n=1 Tax=Aromatoleum sp. TaxID=2307007 RepID=UPI002B47208A|nr:alpha/beta hydrolase [Aromatoleum sp.]HJV26229.1 alpha/beta hydrolase [Aromatoleum sp.]
MKRLDPLAKNNVHIAGNWQAPRTIVFLHGFGTEQSAWSAVAQHFEEDYRLVFLDNVGAGGSLPEAFVQSHYLDLHAYADDLLDVCEALELHDAIFVGHSLGAMTGVLASNKQPTRFSRLALICASPHYLNCDQYQGGFTQDDLNQVYSAIDDEFDEWATAFAPLMMGNPDQPQLARYFMDAIRAIPQDRVMTVLCSIFQSDHRQDIERIEKPALLLQSRDDIAVPPEVTEYLHRHIPGSRLVMLDATGHLPHLSAPAEVAKALRPFVESS